MVILALGLACDAGAGDDSGIGSVESGESWVAVGQGLDSALLAVWGTAWDDVWVVGADSGSGGVFLHFDGATWTRAADLGAGDAWWVDGTAESVWISGAGGRLFRYDIATETLVSEVVDPALVVYGVWAASDTDVWAAAGDPGATSDAAAIFHYDGNAWTQADIPAEAAAQVAMFKIAGNAPDDVWAVGNAGTALHYDGAAWSMVPTGVTPDLFGIRGRYAVGGNFTGTLLAWNGSAFIEETPAYSYQFTGVSDDGVHTPTAVGYKGQVFLRGEFGWELDPAEPATLADLHAVWIDPEGGIWTVGGRISSDPLIHGVLAYKGARTIAPLEAL